jgi:hypothetical protein
MHEDLAPLANCHPEVVILHSALQDSTREYREKLEATKDEATTRQSMLMRDLDDAQH